MREFVLRWNGGKFDNRVIELTPAHDRFMLLRSSLEGAAQVIDDNCCVLELLDGGSNPRAYRGSM